LFFFYSGSSEGSDKLKADISIEGSFKLRLRMQDEKDVRDNKQIVPEKYETLCFIARLVNVMFFDRFSPLITINKRIHVSTIVFFVDLFCFSAFLQGSCIQMR